MNKKDKEIIEEFTYCDIELEPEEIHFYSSYDNGGGMTLKKEHIIAIAKHFKLTEGDLV